MIRSAVERLNDARAYALLARQSASGLSASELSRSVERLNATLFSLVIVGEALGKVPEEIKRLAPDIPWSKPIALRHILVHGYWQVDLKIIVDVVVNGLPPLIEALDRLIVLTRLDEA